MLVYCASYGKVDELGTLDQRPSELATKAADAFATVLAELIFAVPILGLPATTGESIRYAGKNFTNLGEQVSGQSEALQGIAAGNQLQESRVVWSAAAGSCNRLMKDNSPAPGENGKADPVSPPRDEGAGLAQWREPLAGSSEVINAARGDSGRGGNSVPLLEHARQQWPVEVREPLALASQPGSASTTGNVLQEKTVLKMAGEVEGTSSETLQPVAQEGNYAAKEVALAVRLPGTAHLEVPVQVAGKTLQVAVTHLPQQGGYAAGEVSEAWPAERAYGELTVRASVGTLVADVSTSLPPGRVVAQDEASLSPRAAGDGGMPWKAVECCRDAQGFLGTPAGRSDLAFSLLEGEFSTVGRESEAIPTAPLGSEGIELTQEGEHLAGSSKVITAARGDSGRGGNSAPLLEHTRQQWPVGVREPLALASQPGSAPTHGNVLQGKPILKMSGEVEGTSSETLQPAAQQGNYAAKEAALAVRLPGTAHSGVLVHISGEILQTSAQTPLPLSQAMELIAQMVVKIRPKQAVIKLKLVPENLGELTVRVVYENGGLLLFFYTANERAKEAIFSQVHQLQHHLQQSDVRVDSIAVQVNQDAQGWSWREDADSNQGGSSHSLKSFSRESKESRIIELERSSQEMGNRGLNMLV